MDPEVAKRAQQVRLDAFAEVTAEHQVVATQRQQVAAVGAFGGRRQAEQEPRPEVLDQPTVGVRRRVMELVDDDVVEVIHSEALQVLRSAQRLDRREQHGRILVLLRAGELAHHATGPDATEGRQRLIEDLVAVCDEQDTLRLRWHADLERERHRVERRQPRLAEAGGEHDEPCAIAEFARAPQCCQRLALDRMCGRGRQFLRRDLDDVASGGHDPARAVVPDPLRRERYRVGVQEQLVKPTRHRREADRVRTLHDAVVPLDAVPERRAREAA